MAETRREIAMMFTGGVDTTLAAAGLLESDPNVRLHLLTFCNGFCVRIEASQVHVEELRQRFGPERILHEMIYVTEIFEELRSPFLELVRKYRSTLVFDLCCRLSFETAAVIYCLNNDVHQLACGTNIDQGKLFLERPEYLQVARDYFASFGIDYFTPVYGRMGGRFGRMDQLRQRNLSTGPKLFEKISITSSLFHQPFCLFGIHTFFFTSFARNLPGFKQVVSQFNLSTEAAIQLRLDRQRIAREIVARRTATAQQSEQEDGLTIQERFCTTRLCGLAAVEITLPRNTAIDIARLAQIWSADSRPSATAELVTAKRGKLELQVFRAGRVVIHGTRDRQVAVRAYEQEVACHDVFVAVA